MTIMEGKPARATTRDRVLDTALALFNAKGPDRVTTAEIARSAHINEGNLYYYFRTKEALILALFSRFEGEATALVARAASSPGSDIAPYAFLLRQWFELAWAFRFFFRDLASLSILAPALAERIRQLSGALRGAVESLVEAMSRQRLIHISGKERAALLANIWIVATYWASYLSLQEGVEDLTPAHLDWGLNQVASLFRPYLAPDVKDDLDRIIGS